MMLCLPLLLLLHNLIGLWPHVSGSEIIDGENAKNKAMLYMASVQDINGRHTCGGFLISKDFVVTAAHCDDVNPTSVVLGTHNLKRVNNDTMRYPVKRCKHPAYVDLVNGPDIMLLKLTRPAKLSKKVMTIPLPTMKIKNKKKCIVAGWGYTRTGGTAVDKLRRVDVSIIDLDVCKKEWGSIPTPITLPDSVICAGGYKTKKGFCQGDSGGPLVCDGKAVGVVSFNMRGNCDYPNIPNVYTSVTKFLPWIKKILKNGNC